MQHDFNDPAYCKALKNLFTPGSGGRPPVLAGREAEQALLGDYLDAATEDPGNRGRLKRPIPHDIILYGPRGNGKTVLLGDFRERCDETTDQQVEKVDTLNVKAAEVKTLRGLSGTLLGGTEMAPGKMGQAVAEARQAAGGQDLVLSGAQVGLGGSALTWEKRDEDEVRTTLAGALMARCRQRPLVVTLDEAHKLDIEVGNLLLNVSQKLREENYPFLLVLAGTPNLEAHLGKMDATFWDRSKVVPMGRLDAAGARVALVAPLVDLSVRFDRDALDKVVADSQHYPYFIQLWGKALCDVLIKSKQGKQITAQVVDEAFPAVAAERRRYYSVRYNEMRDQDLLDAAERVAGAFAGRGALRQAVVISALLDAPGVDAAKALEQFEGLSELGYLWRAPQKQEEGDPPPPDIEPGIPSLMTHVSEELQADREALYVEQMEAAPAPPGP